MASPDIGERPTRSTIQSTGYLVLPCLPVSLSPRMVTTPLIRTLENAESVTIRMAAPESEAGKPNATILRLQNINLQNPNQNLPSPSRSRTRTDLPLNNHLNGSNLPQLSLLLMYNHPNSRLRLPPARRAITRMLRAR